MIQSAEGDWNINAHPAYRQAGPREKVQVAFRRRMLVHKEGFIFAPGKLPGQILKIIFCALCFSAVSFLFWTRVILPTSS